MIDLDCLCDESFDLELFLDFDLDFVGDIGNGLVVGETSAPGDSNLPVLQDKSAFCWVKSGHCTFLFQSARSGFIPMRVIFVATTPNQVK